MAVPSFEVEFQRCLGAGAEAQPPGESLRHLAMHRKRLASGLRTVGEGLFDHRGTDIRWGADADVRPEEREHLLDVARVDERERGPRNDVVTV